MRHLLRAAICALLDLEEKAPPETGIAVAPMEPHYTWQVISYGGGATITLPNLTRIQAMSDATKLGVVSYIDDDCKFIFVKPRGFSPALPEQMTGG